MNIATNDDAFDYIGSLTEELSIAPADLLGSLADLRRAATARDVVALRAAVRATQKQVGELAFALSIAATVSQGVAPDLRAA